ncbi:MAG: DUF3488 and DUF4129 domain-containing transglutaminase family protein [Acidimicrobiales bacterium]
MPLSRWWVRLGAAMLGALPLLVGLSEGTPIWPVLALLAALMVGSAAVGVVRPVLFVGLAAMLARWGDVPTGWIVAWGGAAVAVLMAQATDRWPERWIAQDPATARRSDRAWIGRHVVRWLPLVAILVFLLPALVDGLGRPSVELADGDGEGDTASPYWGFSDQLDTSARGELGDQEMMRVWADRPDFWRGQTFDRWDGRFWTASDTTTVRLEAENPMHPLPGVGDVAVSALSEPTVSSSQTYELVGAGTDVVFAAYRPVELISSQWSWSRVEDGSIVSDWMPAGSVYEVQSERVAVTPDLLRRQDPTAAELPSVMAARFLDEGAVTDRVRALAEEITADAPTTYDKVRSLEAWMSENIEYTRDIPVPPSGADAIEQLLFVDKAGFCEQIGTALTMMLRSLGVPSRLAVGYVTGEQVGDDEYLVRAEDAHAWVEIWFPGLGWQEFDPTASVPLAGEASANEVGVPWLEIAIAAAVLALVVGAQWWWRRHRARRDDSGGDAEFMPRPPSMLTTALVDEGARRGVERRSTETVGELAHRVVAETKGDERFVSVAELATRASFGPAPLDPEDEQGALDVIADLAREEPIPS